MPTILFRHDQDVSPNDVMKIAVYAEYVSRQCYNVFEKDGSRSRSEALSRRARDVSDALDFGDKPYFSPETTRKVLEFRDAVWGICFDYFGERGHMGKSTDLLRMDLDVEDVLDKLVIYHLSPQEIEETEAEWAHEGQFFANEGADPGIHVPQWQSVRKVKDGLPSDDLYAFLTTDPNDVVKPIHGKAMPVLLLPKEETDVWSERHGTKRKRWPGRFRTSRLW
jgi:hypothetical protein